MTGGIPAALVLCWERIKRQQLSVRTFVLIFLVCGFVAAAYRAWHDEYSFRMVAISRHAEHVAQLKKFYGENHDLMLEVIRLPKDDQHGMDREWVKINDFSHRLETWLDANMGHAAESHLFHLPRQVPVQVSTFSKDQNSTLFALQQTADSINDLITEPAWDAP